MAKESPIKTVGAGLISEFTEKYWSVLPEHLRATLITDVLKIWQAGMDEGASFLINGLGKLDLPEDQLDKLSGLKKLLEASVETTTI